MYMRLGRLNRNGGPRKVSRENPLAAARLFREPFRVRKGQ